MRVLHILNAAGGGASVGALELMRSSREMGSAIKHFVVYPGLDSDPDPTVSSVCSACRVVPMRWWNIKQTLSPLRRRAVWVREMQVTRFGHRTRSALRDLVHEWRVDLIHSNTAAIIDGATVAAELGISHVWHIRERIGCRGFMRFPLTDAELAARIGSLSRVIVPMSRFVREVFVKQGQAAKTRVVYDGVDPAIFDTEKVRRRGRELRRSWGVPDGSLLIGKVAAVTSPVKRHDVFIRAAGILARRDPSLRFAIIGPLPKLTTWARRQGIEYFQALRQLVREEGIEDRFLWTDHVPDSGAMMNAIDVLAHACDLEGFGRIAIEAMAAGKPVVGPAAGGFMESVVDGETGFLVPPGDETAMAEAIEELCNDSDLYRRFCKAGRTRSREDFSPEAHLSAIREVYLDAFGKA